MTDDAAFWHRIQFAFTITYHYLFPQLTMGLAWFLVAWKWLHLRTGEARYGDAARLWARIFGINFAVGVVTGIPMEFQFGTNWAGFSQFAGGVIGQTLAMEGMFAFFLESAFIGALVWGENRLGLRSHFVAALAVALGSWLSGYFILVANAFMQSPSGHAFAADGSLRIASFGGFLLSRWAVIEFLHNQCAAVVTGSFAIAAVGAFYVLRGDAMKQGQLFLKWGTAVGLLASLIAAYPTGDAQAKMVARKQPAALAAMEGRFQSGPMADITLIGQPNVRKRQLDNPIRVPGMLSFLAFGTFHRDVPGLGAFPEDTWPTNIELLYYAFHVMAGLGTLFILLMALANLQRLRGGLESNRPLLWVLMMAFPFPFIANTAGWMTAELGRQPWLIYGLLRTRDGYSVAVGSGEALFTLIGFTGLYFALGLVYLFLIGLEVMHGAGEHAAPATPEIGRA